MAGTRADPGKYRPDDEVAAWLAKDPIRGSEPGSSSMAFRRPSSTRSTVEVKAAPAAGEAEAKAGPEPSAAVLETQVVADGGSSWRSVT